MQFLKDRNEDFMLNEASMVRPLKVVLKGLHEDTDTSITVEDLEEKGYKINRILQMKNFRLKPPVLLPVRSKDNWKVHQHFQ
ncbi:hypothetical protein AVEN_41488-1 [Araneus ventricosus]|uniref:Pre-C2HC domain-containing protein n=1 Tax=Araneus ventricosus TaxID=182803 RepID=A0A4Y2NT69_ARAVE|nr:hypothetical protein AVEN_34117-1 [Araneus ventricosus]GBN42822.1 hypothetical protein AVEN_41488-1 [Araneus ventricosus]